MQFLKNIYKPLQEIKVSRFALAMSLITLVLFHKPFFQYVIENTSGFSSAFLIISLVVVMILCNFLVYYLFFSLSVAISKVLLGITLIINSISLYFISTYGVIVDESMIGNVFNTKYEEASGFFSMKMIFYLAVLAILPIFFLLKAKIKKDSPKTFVKTSVSTLAIILILAFANSPSWLWVDKNSKYLGGLAMPWNYSVNTALHFIHKSQKNEKEILLKDAKIVGEDKKVVVLIIGESARRENFSLYGYNRQTNPLLGKRTNLHHFRANSCATYTTEGVKCILQSRESSKLYEMLPNYLYRTGVDVTWKTSNWGEPPIHIEKYIKLGQIMENCHRDDCNWDGALVGELAAEIQKSQKNRVLIVIHTSTSHGPQYSEKYPKKFEKFTPVCQSVELKQCSQEQLINAYDNTILYTDYIIDQAIEELKKLKDWRSSLIYVSDHGESLGEKNLYMHGVPMAVAPKQQYQIPFIVWSESRQVKDVDDIDQGYVFHSVLNFLSIESPEYVEEKNIFK